MKLLVLEDDSLDVMDLKRTLDKMGILNIMQVARNGEEAVAYLASRGAHELPDVVLLDLNMPKMNGLEFLSALRAHDAWKHLKVFVLTTSAEREDIEEVKKLGISGYIVKPLKLNNPASIDAFNLMIDLMNIKNRI